MPGDIVLNDQGATVIGSLGVGTEAPSAPLHVHGAEVLSSGDNAGYAFLDRHAPHPRWVWYAAAGEARLYIDGNGDRLSVGADGNVHLKGSLVAGVIRGMALGSAMLILEADTLQLKGHERSGFLDLGRTFVRVDKPSGQLVLAPKGSFKGVAIGSTVTVEGDVHASGALTQRSSRAAKDEIRPLALQDAESALAGLSAVTFRYRDLPDQQRHAGFVAEDVPDWMTSPQRNAIAPMDVIAVLTRVVQAQQVAIGALHRQLAVLEGTVLEGTVGGAAS